MLTKKDIKQIITEIIQKSKEHLDGNKYIRVEEVIDIIDKHTGGDTDEK